MDRHPIPVQFNDVEIDGLLLIAADARELLAALRSRAVEIPQYYRNIQKEHPTTQATRCDNCGTEGIPRWTGLRWLCEDCIQDATPVGVSVERCNC
jgi:hypothetical protein